MLFSIQKMSILSRFYRDPKFFFLENFEVYVALDNAKIRKMATLYTTTIHIQTENAINHPGCLFIN